MSGMKETALDRLDGAIIELVETHGWPRESVEKVVSQMLNLLDFDSEPVPSDALGTKP